MARAGVLICCLKALEKKKGRKSGRKKKKMRSNRGSVRLGGSRPKRDRRVLVKEGKRHERRIRERGIKNLSKT